MNFQRITNTEKMFTVRFWHKNGSGRRNILYFCTGDPLDMRK